MKYECHYCKKIFKDKEVIMHTSGHFESPVSCFECYAKINSTDEGFISSKFNKEKYKKIVAELRRR